MRFEGIYTPVITPFREDLSLDEPGYARLVEHQIAQGVHGLIIGGTTGEFYALTHEERLIQFRLAQRVIGGRRPWLAGVNHLRADEVCALAAAARDAGADGLLLGAPPYALPTGRELAQHALRVDRAAGLPIMLYNYPGRTGAEMDRAFLKAVKSSANIRAIKESSGELARLQLIACEFPELQLVCGADDQALEFFAWGARAWVSGAANFLLPEALALYEACVVRGDFAEGRRIMAALLPVLTVLERGGQFLACVKYACGAQGLPAGPVRPPLGPLSAELIRETDRALALARKVLAEPQAPSAAARQAGRGARP
ncbi:MAG TPA: dihydrodipicolinate synthase family protein [Alphaproteobacteria bacterium]|nr:dihydrodipicolinate synthase family protein [Alphaproteobacteria bacterium]